MGIDSNNNNNNTKYNLNHHNQSSYQQKNKEKNNNTAPHPCFQSSQQVIRDLLEKDESLSPNLYMNRFSTSNPEEFTNTPTFIINTVTSGNSAVINNLMNKNKIKIDEGALDSSEIIEQINRYENELIRDNNVKIEQRLIIDQENTVDDNDNNNNNNNNNNNVRTFDSFCEQSAIIHGPTINDQVPNNSGICAYTRFQQQNTVLTSKNNYPKISLKKKKIRRCNVCGKDFSRPSSLEIHKNIHTGIKPFVCPYKDCNKTFNVKSNMIRHSKLHEKLKPKSNE